MQVLDQRVVGFGGIHIRVHADVTMNVSIAIPFS